MRNGKFLFGSCVSVSQLLSFGAVIFLAGGLAMADATDSASNEAKSLGITPDKVVMWLLVGLIVGRFVGLFLAPTNGGIGPIGSLILGLAGAFVGGIALDKSGVHLDLGTLEIRYADVVAAVVGAFILVGIYWAIRLKTRRIGEPKDKGKAMSA